MGFFFQGYTLISILGFFALVLGLIVLNELTRRSKIFSIIMYVLVPIVLAILILVGVVSSPSSKTWFGVMKTYSALAGVIGFMIIRYTKVQHTKFAMWFPMLILAINIVEAIYRDFEVFATYKIITVDAAGLTLLGGPWNIMNGIAGIFLILTMTGWVGIKVSKTKSKDMVWADQLWFWIIAYDLWNIAYCYNCIPNRSLYSGVVLIVSCTLAEFVLKRGIWLQHRAQTLALFGMFSLAFNYQESPLCAIRSTFSPAPWTVLSAIALAFNFGLFVYEVIYIIKKKRNPIKQELYVDLKSYKKNLEANNL